MDQGRIARLSAGLLLAVVMIPALASAQTALSQPIIPSDCNGQGGCQSICDIATVAQNVLNVGIFVIVFLSAILFAWGGWKYLTAMGNETEVHAAKGLLWNVMIGLVLILAAWLLVNTLMQTLTGNSVWNSIC
jgi:uncharacterized membrane protein